MLQSIKVRFLSLKRWQQALIVFVLFSIVVSPFTNGGQGKSGTTPSTLPPLPTSSVAANTPIPSAVYTAAPSSDMTLIGKDNCHWAYKGTMKLIASAGDWANSLITDVEFADIVKDVDDLLLGASAYSKDADGTAWLLRNETRMRKARVQLIQGSINSAADQIIAAEENLVNGLAKYCSGYSE